MLRWLLISASLLLAAAPAQAEPDFAGVVDRAIEGHVLPGYDQLLEATAALAETAKGCDEAATKAAYHAAFDAWMGISHLAFGPAEAEGRMFALAFWPDPKGFAAKALRRLIADEDAVVDDPSAFAERSVAARGLLALDRLLYDPEIGATSAYRCRLAAAIARDMAATAAAIRADWDAYAAGMRNAGLDGSPYGDKAAAARAFYGALLGGLEVTEDLRLGGPLGALAKPRPTLAEGWRSGRPLRNVRLSLEALEGLFETAFAPALTESGADAVRSAFDYALKTWEKAPEPLVEAVAEPAGRFKIEALKSAVGLVRDAVAANVGGGLDLAQGFNARDGD